MRLVMMSISRALWLLCVAMVLTFLAFAVGIGIMYITYSVLIAL